MREVTIAVSKKDLTLDPRVIRGATVEETLALAKGALTEEMKKSITTSLGLMGYPLEAPSKKIFPVYTKLRNRFPRLGVNGEMGDVLHWKKLTGINTGKLWATVAEGLRNGKIAYATADASAAFKTFGLDDDVTQEAVWYGRTFEDVRALSVLSLLQSVMMMEERLILGGSFAAIATPVAPTLAQAATGGALSDATYKVKVSALTMQGWFGGAKGRVGGTTDSAGETVAGASTTIVVNGGGAVQKITASWPAIAGAFAYNVYIDDGAGGAFRWNQTVVYNKATIVSNPAGDPSNTGGLSANALDFPGLFIQIDGEAGAYNKSLDGAALTGDAANGVTEIEDAFEFLYRNYLLGPTVLQVSTSVVKSLKAKVIANGGSSIIRVTKANGEGMDDIGAGSRVSAYYNAYTGEDVPIEVHPYLPDGHIMGLTESLPYPNSNVPDPIVIRTAQEYYNLEYAMTQRKYEHGIYANEVLQMYMPASCLHLRNVG